MKFLLKVSNSIQRFANKKYIITLFIMFLVIIVIMGKSPVSSSALKRLNAGIGMLDMQFGYSQLQVYNMLEIIGIKGQQHYSEFLGIDFVFAVVFMLLQALLITLLLKKAEVDGKFVILNLLPFVRSVMDIIENCLILTIIFNYPVKLPLIVELSSAVTMLKWIIYSVILALLFLLGALITFKSINTKIRLKRRS